jgi:DHA2 family multidrug resistance protein-like MFS transporter
VAIVGSVVSSAYRLFFNAPAGVPAEAAERASESVGQALVAATRLPAEVGGPLVETARAAYIEAVRYGYWVSAAVLVCTLVFVRRNVPATGLVHEPESTPSPGVPVGD